jgi:hypothetical protein
VRVEDYIHTSIVYRFVSYKQPPSSLQLELITNESIARIRHRVQRVLERVRWGRCDWLGVVIRTLGCHALLRFFVFWMIHDSCSVLISPAPNGERELLKGIGEMIATMTCRAFWRNRNQLCNIRRIRIRRGPRYLHTTSAGQLAWHANDWCSLLSDHSHDQTRGVRRS